MAIRARWRIGAAVVLGSLASIGEAAAAEDDVAPERHDWFVKPSATSFRR